MKKAFYSLLGLFMVTSATYAQTEYKKIEDLTKAKLVNADFKADAPVSVTIRTYDYDMTDEGAGNGGTALYGQQTITGWTAAAPSDNIKVSASSSDARTDGVNARAAGIFAFTDENGDGVTFSLGGDIYDHPYIILGEHEGPALGMLAVWGAEIQYTQEVTLAPGAYLIEIPICCTVKEGGMTSLNGFIASDGTQYLSTFNEYQVDAYAWTTDQIAFILDKETTGVISIGYRSGGNGSAKSPHLYYEGVKLYKIDPNAVLDEKIAAAKEDLLKVIEAGEQVGANTKDAEAVYNNANATLEEVLQAIEDQKALNDASVLDLSEFFIKNPHFNQDEAIPAGEAITTYARDRKKNGVSYYGMLPVKGWVASNPAGEYDIEKESGDAPNDGRACGVVSVGSGVWLGGAEYQVPMTMSDGSAEGNLLGFVTCWGFTTQYTQGVTIPAGKYTLSISYYNTGGAEAVSKNLMGFIANNGDEYLSDVKQFKVGSWEKMQVSFVLDEPTAGKFSVGYTAAGVGSAKMPHFFIDGISLNYVGDTNIDPSLFALQAAVSSGQELLNEDFYADLKEEFQKAVEDGESLVMSQSSDADANATATEAINGLLEDIEASIKAYEKLASFRENELEAAYQKYESFAALQSQLQDMIDEIDMDALQDYTWTTEKINETIASLDPMIKEAIQVRFDEIISSGEEVTEPFDITAITPGLSYTYSTSAQSGANVPDKEWAYGTASNFKTQYGTAEVWNQSPFEIKRTLTDMPAGTYTVTTRAFYRTADNQVNYDSYDKNNHLAFLWAGHAKAPLTNVVELASADGAGYTNPAEINGMFIPNNQQTAHDIFVNDDYKEIVETSVSTVLTEPGELCFGICGADDLSDNSWVVWYSFELAYKSVDTDVLAQEVEGLVNEANGLLEVSEVAKAATELDKAMKQGEAAISSGKTEDLVAASTALNDAITYANNSAPLIEKLTNLADQFVKILEASGIEGTDETFINLITAASNGGFESNEQIEGYIKDIPAAWTKYVVSQSGVKNASDAEPFDLTAAIVNAGFEMGDLTGWTAASGTGDTGVKENSNETYTINNAEGSYVFNTWNGSAIDFFLEQTIEGLPAGTYRIEAIFASDADNVVTLDVAGSTVDVTTTDKIEGIETALDFNVTAGQAVTIKVTSPSWFKADNFRLTYFGANSANAIANVESATAASTVYTVSGARTANLKKGVNIVKYTDGSVKKVLVK